jgi:hypothetical protein
MRSFLTRVAAALAATAVVATLVIGLSPFTDGEVDWSQRVQACAPSGEEDTERVEDCVQAVALQAAERGELRLAAASFTTAAAEDNIFYGICHRALHELGSRLVEVYGTVEQALPHVNTIDCGNALAHGVFDEWATNDIDPKEFELVVAQCERVELENPGGCAEGIGHAAYQHQSPSEDRLEDAFRLCELFRIEYIAQHCAYGAYMQPYFKQNDLLISEMPLPIPTGAELVTICEGLDLRPDVVRGCFSGAGWLMGLSTVQSLLRFPGTPEQVEQLGTSRQFALRVERLLGYCENSAASSGDRQECSTQLLSRLPVAWYQDLTKLTTNCQSLGTLFGDRIRVSCLAGAYEFVPPSRLTELLTAFPETRDEINRRHLRERGSDLSAPGA